MFAPNPMPAPGLSTGDAGTRPMTDAQQRERRHSYDRKPIRWCVHFDPEVGCHIEDTLYRLDDGRLYRELSRPSGYPETKMWRQLTSSLMAKEF